MRPIFLVVCAAALPCAPAALAGANAEQQDDTAKARELLEAVAKAMKEAKELSYEGRRLQDGSEDGRFSVQIRRPDLARIEHRGGADHTDVFDGKSHWQYVNATHEYFKETQGRPFDDVRDYVGFPFEYVFLDRRLDELFALTKEVHVTKEKLEDEECDVMQWKQGWIQLRTWIDGKKAIRKVETELWNDGWTKREGTTTCLLGTINLSPKLGDDVFKFSPLQDAHGPQPREFYGEKLLAVDSIAPDFEATDLNGKKVKLSDFKGKPVVLYFWISWPGSSLGDIPRIQNSYENYKEQGVVFLAVNNGDNAATIQRLSEHCKIALRCVREKEGEISRAFGVRAYPTMYLIGADGNVRARTGWFDDTSIWNTLNELLNARDSKDLLDGASARMKDAAAIYVEGVLREGTGSPPLKTDWWNSQTVKIWLKRPNLARIEITADDRTKSDQDQTIVLDGKSIWFYRKSTSTYSFVPQALRNWVHYGTSPLILLLKVFLGNGSGKLLGTGWHMQEGGRSAKKYRWGWNEEVCLGGKKDLRELIVTFHETHSSIGPRSNTDRLHSLTLGDMDLSPKFADDTFTFTPPKDAQGGERLNGREDRSLLAVGSAAPDFEVTDMDGKKVRLSDFAGKPVVLAFRPTACDEGSDEYLPLRQLFEDYKDRGVVVISVCSGHDGTNSVDGKFVREFLSKEVLTCSPLHEKKDEVSKAYGVRWPPAYYVLAGDRKVAAAAIEFDELRLRAALEKLAPKK